MDQFCIFCRLSQEVQQGRTEVLGQNAEFFVLQDLQPQAPLHALVIPKRHYDSLDDVRSQSESTGVSPAALLGRLLQFASEMGRTLTSGLYPGGYRLVINTGAGAGQSIFHLHCHILSGALGHFGEAPQVG